MIINFTKSSKQDPAYLVSGVSQQSHWLAENSVLSGSTVENVTDEFGLENLVKFSTSTPTYEANGWGGDSGPSILINGHSLTANGWATRVSGSLTPFIMTAKIQILETTDYHTPWGFSSGTNDNYPLHLSPRKRWSYNQSEVFRCAYTSYSSTYFTQIYGTPNIWDQGRHNIVAEYTGGAHRLWIDGAEMSYAYNKTRYVGYYCNFTTFMVGGYGNLGTNSPCNLRLAELHIYRPFHGVFSNNIRNKLITDLQNRRGT